MSRQEQTNRSGASEEPRADSQEVTRVDEQGEADEADAPTAVKENEGMSAILDAGPLTGVQDNASEE